MKPISHARPTTPGQILQRALDMETQARDFYAELARRCSTDFVRELLEKLQNEESKHMRMIQEMRARFESGKDPV
jgi:rubrerythrin